MLSPLMHDDELAQFQTILDHLPDDAHIVEFGCGGSTCWLADRLKPDQTLDSVEHNPEWYHTVLLETAESTRQITLHLCPPDLDLTRYKYSCAEEEMPAGLTAYLNPPINWSDVSLVFVDGVARGAVLALTAQRVPKGTTVLLHDFIGRERWYEWTLGLYEPSSTLTNSLLQLRS